VRLDPQQPEQPEQPSSTMIGSAATNADKMTLSATGV
jgi:hypothetical protein